jgi:4-hydroxythreonine-4-phosphate dehydrogenase
MSLSKNKYKIGITTGDINGIGIEVIIKTFSDSRMSENIIPVLYGSSKVVNFHRKALNIKEFNFANQKNVEKLQPNTLNIINCYEEDVVCTLGIQNEIGGKYALISLEAATKDLIDRKIDAIITAPINKKNIQSPGFVFNGQTEYLSSKANAEALMIMLSGELRVATLTTHIPVKDIASAITKDKIEKKVTILDQTLRRDFGIDKPRIAILGLNPHAGDSGLIGNEENTEIIPAIKNLKQKGLMVFGPYSADGFFGSGQFTKFDGILAMYHDQGLIPFKALSFGSGTNYTAGLPFIRTSPDHGTGFDIAGRNLANEDSFRQAIFEAIDILENREAYEERNANPLKRQELSKERNY